MEAFGAEILRIDGDYDASVHRCAEDAAAKGWFVVSDTSYDGYSALPRQVMAGYALMASEEIGRAHVELQSLMRISYAVFCLKKKTPNALITAKSTHSRNTYKQKR